MKAPAFWFRPAGLTAFLLSPLACVFRMGTRLRRFFAWPYQAGVPVICVGNVVVGGSGKTPTALAIAALLQKQGHRPVFVTRGYGGAQHGPLRVEPDHHSAEDVGDEAMLLQRQAPVWIGRDRAATIRAAEKEATHIILDDGLQNPHIKPDISLLVIDGAVGLGNGRILPAGPLREPLTAALKRVAAVVIVGEESEGLHKIESVFSKPILRAHLKPSIPAGFKRDAAYLAFAGIGRPEKFYALLRKEGLNIVATEDFPDHHPFSQGELDRLEQKARSLGAQLLTTEKDFVRLPTYMQKRVMTFPILLEFEDVGRILNIVGSKK